MKLEDSKASKMRKKRQKREENERSIKRYGPKEKAVKREFDGQKIAREDQEDLAEIHTQSYLEKKP